MTQDEPDVVTKLSPCPVDGGQTKISYYSPGALAARHHLGADLAGNLAAVNALTDALIAS